MKSAKQQAAVAMSMKAAGKKPKVGMGGMPMLADRSMMIDSMMKKGGALKTVPSNKTGLKKLPTAVRNKMGYKKVGGSVSKTKK